MIPQRSVILMEEPDMKSLFATKTFWVNLISGAVALLESQELLNVIPDVYEAGLVVVVFGLNIVLRYITTQPVKPLLGESPK